MRSQLSAILFLVCVHTGSNRTDRVAGGLHMCYSVAVKIGPPSKPARLPRQTRQKAPLGLTHAKKLYAPEAWIERIAALLARAG